MGDQVLQCPQCRTYLVRRVVWATVASVSPYVDDEGIERVGMRDARTACPCCGVDIHLPSYGWLFEVQLLPLADLEVK